MRHLTLQQLSAAIDDALVGVSLEMVRRHLAACDECRSRRERLAARDALVARLASHAIDEAWLEDHAIAIEALIEADAGGTPGSARPARAPRRIRRIEAPSAETPMPPPNAETVIAAPPSAAPPALSPADPMIIARLAAELSAALAPPVSTPSPPANAHEPPVARAESAVSRVELPQWGGVKIEVRRAKEAAPRPIESPAPAAVTPPTTESPAPAAVTPPTTESPAPAPAAVTPPTTESPAPAAATPPALESPMLSSADARPPLPAASTPVVVPRTLVPPCRSYGSASLYRERRLPRVERAPRQPREAMPLVTGLLGGVIAGALVILMVLGPRTASRRASSAPSAPTRGASAGARPLATSAMEPSPTPVPASAGSPALATAPTPTTPNPSRMTSAARAVHAIVARSTLAGATVSTPPAEKPAPPVARVPASPAASVASISAPAAPPTPAPVPPANSASPPPASAPVQHAVEPASSSEDSDAWPLLCGAVADSAGAPLVGARVELTDLAVGTRTDRRGHFCLAAPSGAHTLQISAPGFSIARREVGARDFGQELAIALAARR